MSDSVIASRPPNDGREWDCQCARCGSSVIHSGCPSCGGDGFTADEDDERVIRCDDCNGRGRWLDCGSSDEWCEANPRTLREDTARGAIEWFVIGGAR